MDNVERTLYIDSRYLSPYALSAYVALLEKGLNFTICRLDLAAGEHNEAPYAATSLTGRVPTLVDGDFSLSESSAISEYLEEQYPPPEYAALLPVNRRARARARQIQAWLRSDLMALREERSTEMIFVETTDRPLSAAATSAAARLFAAANALLAEGAHHLFGDWSIVDTDLALMLNRLVLNKDPVPEKLAAYARHQWLRPSVQRWIAAGRLAPREGDKSA